MASLIAESEQSQLLDLASALRTKCLSRRQQINIKEYLQDLNEIETDLLAAETVSAKQAKRIRLELEDISRRLDAQTQPEVVSSGNSTIAPVELRNTTNNQTNNIDGDLHNYTSHVTNYNYMQTTVVGTDKTQKELQDLRKWLHVPPPSDSLNRHLEMRTADTGLWILKNEIFVDWKSASASVLWLYGQAGAGKSVLSSTIIDNLRTFCQQDLSATIAYFYCSYQVDAETNVAHLVRSVASQLIGDHLDRAESLEALYKETSGSTPQISKLVQCLPAIVNVCPGSVYIVIDGLDEISDRRTIHKYLHTLIDLKIPNLHLLITSRPEVDIGSVLYSLLTHPAVDIRQAGIIQDISSYVDYALATSERLSHQSDDVKKLIRDTLMSKSQGMFRWAFCQMELLEQCKSRGQIKKTLLSLPVTLHATYDKILNNIDEDHREGIYYVLNWICFFNPSFITARQPSVHIQQIQSMTGIRRDADGIFRVKEDDVLESLRDVLLYCSSLVVVDSIGYLYLAHFSVQEYLSSTYLQATTNPLRQFYLDEQIAYATIVKCCVAILIYSSDTIGCEQKELEELGRTHDHNGYVSAAFLSRLVWMSYCENVTADDEFLDQHVAMLIRPGSSLKDTDQSIDRWWPIYPTEKRPTALALACQTGRTSVVQALLHGSISPEAFNRSEVDFLDIPSIEMCLRRYKEELAIALLEKGCSDGILYPETLSHCIRIASDQQFGSLEKFMSSISLAQGPDDDYMDALMSLAHNGHLEHVKTILSSNGNCSDNPRCSEILTRLLETAIRSDQTGIAILAIESGLNVQNKGYMPPLHPLEYATSLKRFDIVRSLIKAGADPNEEREGWSHEIYTALKTAVGTGSTELVNILLEAGALVDQGATTNEPNNTALTVACSLGNLEMVRLLIAQGADLALSDRGVLRACDGGYLDIVNLLFDSGTTINLRDPRLLQNAVRGGNPQIVKKVLASGIDVNVADPENGFTALHFAACGYKDREKIKIMTLLLEAGAAIDSDSKDGTPLELAVSHASLDVVQWLVERGAAVNNPTSSRDCRTALHRAVDLDVEDLEMVVYLLDAGADPNAIVESRGTPLQNAVIDAWYPKDILRILVARGADVNVNSPDFPSPLQRAAAHGELIMVRLLLDAGADVNAKDKLGKTPLSEAVNSKHWEVVAVLEDAGAVGEVDDNRDDPDQPGQPNAT